jgi:pyruvate formate lyase activating enzyme
MGDLRVRCRLCAHGCVISPGQWGVCRVRVNEDGVLMSSVYGRLVARQADPMEKKPLFHFYPGTDVYSLATVGCNFTCRHCQNHFISQYPRDHNDWTLGERVSAGEVIREAQSLGCRSIAFTYTEPTIAIEYVLEVMEAAREAGLANVWVSNGYFTADASARIIPLLDAANIDLKGISDDILRKLTGAGVGPVLHTIERLVNAGVWVEVTTLVIPGVNDRLDELRSTAEAVRGISRSIPWHVSRFFPAYLMCHLPPTPIETLEIAQRIGREAGLRFVYLGNLPGQGGSTHCPSCGAVVIQRSGASLQSMRLVEGSCSRCGESIPGVWGPWGTASRND